MAVVLGVRCWKDRIALVALAGDPGDDPDVVLHRRAKLPSSARDAERVVWVNKTVAEAIEESGADALAVRVSDADPDQVRSEHEGIALFAAASRALPVTTLRRQSMVKPLGVRREAGAWKEFPKTDGFISGFVGDEKDAAMAARAMLNRGTAS
jgi:hypothetical protein